MGPETYLTRLAIPPKNSSKADFEIAISGPGVKSLSSTGMGTICKYNLH